MNPFQTGKRSPKFVQYLETLIVAAVQSNALLFVFCGKFKFGNVDNLEIIISFRQVKV